MSDGPFDDDDDPMDEDESDDIELWLLDGVLDDTQSRLEAAFDRDWLGFMWFDRES